MPLFLFTGCGDLEPDMQDTRTVILNMDFHGKSSLRSSSSISDSDLNLYNTHLILAVPSSRDQLTTSNYITYYNSSEAKKGLMDYSVNRNVSLGIPLYNHVKIFAFLFRDNPNWDDLDSGTPTAGYYGESQSSIYIEPGKYNYPVSITLQGTGIDNTAPTVSFSPANGETGVNISDNIIITFSEAVRNIDNTELTDSNIDSDIITLKLNNASGSNISFDATINTEKTVITIDPVNDLPYSLVVYVAIGATLEDSSDNPITANATFTTMALQPTVAIQPPYDSSTRKYAISTLGHLSYIAQNSSFLAYDFIQTANIDATVTKFWDDEDSNSDGDKYNDANDVTDSGNNEGFLPIGNQVDSFRGEYDGNKKAINGLTITRNSNNYTGLFGYAKVATISKIGLTNVNITGQDSVGQLVGLAHSTDISNCHATSGTVTGNSNVGGLVGYLYGYASITNSYSNVDNVTGSSYFIGGLAGYIENSTILNSYSTGSVVSTSYRGGLVGPGLGTITDSFYDKTTSGQSDTGRGIGKTTAEMKTEATFTNWDFDTIWDIDTSGTINDGYPYLR